MKITGKYMLSRCLAGSRESKTRTKWCGVKRGGEKITTLISPEPIFDHQHQFRGSLAVITDITQRKKTEERLRRMSTELLDEREALKDKNIALRQVLDHLEDEKKAFRHRVSSEIQDQLIPVLRHLKDIAGPREEKRIDSVIDNLETLLSQNIDDFENLYLTLTPREMEICEMIRNGLSSKDMSEVLNLSLLTVHKHRESIRKKLKLNNKEINLSSYLRMR